MTELIITQKSKSMKAAIVLFIAIFFGLTIVERKANGQTVAIGHVSAEIVESISAASAAITDFEFLRASEELTEGFAAETLDLGAITLFSGKDMACEVVLKPAALNDPQGNEFTIEPGLTNETTDPSISSNGSTTFQLGGKTHLADGQASGLYEGTYTVIFAYN